MSGLESEEEHLGATDAGLYQFGGHDVKLRYYGVAGSKAACCPRCGVRIRTWERPYEDVSKRLRYDFNDTDDGKVILSAPAKEHLEKSWPGQTLFRQIFRNAWEAEPVRVLEVTNSDEIIEYSGMPFLEREHPYDGSCPDCGLWFYHTFRSVNFRFGNPEIIEQDGVFRTDICMGWNFRSPLWLAGPKAAFAISAKFPWVA